MTDRKKPSVTFWATVGLVAVLVGYPLSFGPACWIADRCEFFRAPTAKFYRPLLRVAWYGPDRIGIPLSWWAEIGSIDGTEYSVIVPYLLEY